MRRKSTARGSAETVRTLLAEMGYTLAGQDLHISFPGCAPVDGPSAGAAMAAAAISALTNRPVDGSCAVTGEITVHGAIRAVGGVPEKAEAARQAGLVRVFIPKENDMATLHGQGVEIVPVSSLREVLDGMLQAAPDVHTASGETPPAPLPLAARGESAGSPVSADGI